MSIKCTSNHRWRFPKNCHTRCTCGKEEGYVCTPLLPLLLFKPFRFPLSYSSPALFPPSEQKRTLLEWVIFLYSPFFSRDRKCLSSSAVTSFSELFVFLCKFSSSWVCSVLGCIVVENVYSVHRFEKKNVSIFKENFPFLSLWLRTKS